MDMIKRSSGDPAAAQLQFINAENEMLAYYPGIKKQYLYRFEETFLYIWDKTGKNNETYINLNLASGWSFEPDYGLTYYYEGKKRYLMMDVIFFSDGIEFFGDCIYE